MSRSTPVITSMATKGARDGVVISPSAAPSITAATTTAMSSASVQGWAVRPLTLRALAPNRLSQEQDRLEVDRVLRMPLFIQTSEKTFARLRLHDRPE